MNQRTGLSGCQVVGIALTVLLVAVVCMAAGLVVGGGIGLVTGGTAGYAIGRARSTHLERRIEIPLPQPPGAEGWRPPAEFPNVQVRPYLGVRYETTEEGARIVHVEPGSPADQAGLRKQDVILAVDGAPVGAGHPDLGARILEHKPGEKVELRVRRDDKELKLEATPAAQMVIEGRPGLPPGEFPMPPQ
jgi:membrane-associated protease RseP (regulator of RpoE activity)